MNQVLILTKNILAEQKIQQKLQSLNYEVYCSANYLNNLYKKVETFEFLKFFEYIILSETICESEVTQLLPLLKEHSINIIRKVEAKITETDQQYLKEKILNAIISNEDSLDELRECLSKLRNQLGGIGYYHENKGYIQLSEKVSLITPNFLEQNVISPKENYQYLEAIHYLSQTELKILSILIQSGNKVVTRETICHEIWNEEVSDSHLASLSSTITRIKNKFEQTSLKNKAIQTLWGKGYRINPELLSRIQNDDTLFASIVSTS